MASFKSLNVNLGLMFGTSSNEKTTKPNVGNNIQSVVPTTVVVVVNDVSKTVATSTSSTRSSSVPRSSSSTSKLYRLL